jgi:hypothetical protein
MELVFLQIFVRVPLAMEALNVNIQFVIIFFQLILLFVQDMELVLLQILACAAQDTLEPSVTYHYALEKILWTQVFVQDMEIVLHLILVLAMLNGQELLVKLKNVLVLLIL